MAIPSVDLAFVCVRSEHSDAGATIGGHVRSIGQEREGAP